MSDLSTLIAASDKRQSDPATRVTCPIDKSHGGLLANRHGVLVCTGKSRGGQPCEHAEALAVA